ncbi:MAG TPA: protease pro-enzyme activation domain-containing protein [Chthoniobacteraceae bacterium]|nr:protease pro-enzyme activation domain-containing protein [Chthoniobacteraceae bacterium]
MVQSRVSVRTVPAGVAYGPNDERHPYISRANLHANEIASEMRFEVALKMRNFPELQMRIARGEIIPFHEMEDRYFPTQADYDAVTAWLTSQGFKITKQSASRISIFATGSVDKIQKAMKVSFARVSLEGVEYTSAISAPSIPARLATVLVGVNGLQPHIRAHKHLVHVDGAPKNSTDGTVVTSSTNGTSQPYTPAQILHPYSADKISDNGSGQTIAIVIDVLPLKTDLTSFWSKYGVSQSLSNITLTQVTGSAGTPSGEESLDTEWSSSIAPGAKVRVYATGDLASNDLDTGYEAVYEDVIANPSFNLHQMSMSYGIAEPGSTAGQIFTDTQYFAQLASAGVTLFASSGDNGNNPDGVSVENPASDPNVTGVGGTSLTLTSGSAINTEVAWNSSGGGTSIYFSRPPWQNGTGVPAGSTRCVPDIAAPADPNEGAYVWLNGSQQVFGGTSWSSPTWAGFCALLNQARSKAGLGPIGVLAPKLYTLIGTNNFHDITSGNNGYATGTGYDLVTGIGSPNVQNLATTFTQAQALVVPTLPAVATLVPGPAKSGTFTVASSGTAAGNAYQWQRMPIGSGSWSNLAASGTYSGVSGTALTVNGLTAAMSGDQFQCLITNGTNSLTTSPPSVLVVDNQLVVTTLAGQQLNPGWEDGSGTNAIFAYPSGAAIDSSGNVYIADFLNDVIRKVTPSGLTSSPYGQPEVTGSANGSGTNATFNTPNSVAIDTSGNIYVADSSNSTIRKITTSGSVSLLAGKPGRTGTTNGSGTAARFNNPQGVAVDGAGNVYVADTGNNLIRKITASGSVSTLAGVSGTLGWKDGSAASALFNNPISVAADSAGNVYVADENNYVVREISTSGTVSTPYGQGGVIGSADGIGTGALFNSPTGLFIDGSNNIYVADCQVPLAPASQVPGNTTIRRINTSGVVSTIAGTPGTTGTNDGTGPAAQFDSPQFAAVGATGIVYICDTYNQTIRAGGLAPLIFTVAGTQTVTAGQPATFTISVEGSGSVTYQWYYSGSAIASATGATYTIPSASGSNAGNYTVVATDPYGSGTSGAYTLTVNTPIPAMSSLLLTLLAVLLVTAADLALSVKQKKTRGR